MSLGQLASTLYLASILITYVTFILMAKPLKGVSYNRACIIVFVIIAYDLTSMAINDALVEIDLWTIFFTILEELVKLASCLALSEAPKVSQRILVGLTFGVLEILLVKISIMAWSDLSIPLLLLFSGLTTLTVAMHVVSATMFRSAQLTYGLVIACFMHLTFNVCALAVDAVGVATAVTLQLLIITAGVLVSIDINTQKAKV
jgi:hypothetical protein